MKSVCIVGYGAIGPVHASAIQECENARLYAVCDIDANRAQKCVEEYNTKVYTDFGDMLRDDEIDAVHICTPHYLHFEMIKRALEAKKTVVCEKPVTMTKAEYEKLLKLENSDEVCVVLQNRLNPCVRKFREIVQSKELGEVKSVKAVLTWCRTPDYYNSDSWRGRLSTEGGGLLINQAVHTLDFFSYIAGKVKSVKSVMSNFSLPQIEVEDTLMAYLTFETGATGVFFATNAYGDNSSPEFEIMFENGIVKYANGMLFKNNELVEEDVSGCGEKHYWGVGHRAVIKNFYDKGEFFCPKDIENTMLTMYSIYESAKKDGKEYLL